MLSVVSCSWGLTSFPLTVHVKVSQRKRLKKKKTFKKKCSKHTTKHNCFWCLSLSCWSTRESPDRRRTRVNTAKWTRLIRLGCHKLVSFIQKADKGCYWYSGEAFTARDGWCGPNMQCSDKTQRAAEITQKEGNTVTSRGQGCALPLRSITPSLWFYIWPDKLHLAFTKGRPGEILWTQMCA